MIRFQLRPLRCQACGTRLDKGIPLLRRVQPSLLLMHSLCDAVPRDVVDPHDERWHTEYLNVNLAMITEVLQEMQGEPTASPAYMTAVRRVIEEVPHRTQVALSGLITAVVVIELAKAQDRTHEEAWADIALQAALAFPGSSADGGEA